MGRAFEFRKERKFKRWAKMAKVFTRIGKEIAISVKESGPNPETNPRLRMAMQNAKAANMPKDNVERAIKKASGKDQEDYKEMVYEGYAPHGIAIVIETLTDNPTRTVANIRSYFNKCGGNLGTTGSLEFLFDRKSVFKIADKANDLEELELELIDYGVDELFREEEEDGTTTIMLYGGFTDFNRIREYLEANHFEIKESGFERIPHENKELTADQKAEVEKLIDKIEEDDDVSHVFTNMA
ncbi:MAG: YebC/PmpR family DNA-binding transcriptional regulator [Flavobacteriales bacterium]|nr:YebC/PmpR family DNA-binding transcriptional regulator [Flavobacteriales bacterium]